MSEPIEPQLLAAADQELTALRAFLVEMADRCPDAIAQCGELQALIGAAKYMERELQPRLKGTTPWFIAAVALALPSFRATAEALAALEEAPDDV